jgi:hypothetical protein
MRRPWRSYTPSTRRSIRTASLQVGGNNQVYGKEFNHKIGKSQQNACVQVYLSLNCFPPPLLSYPFQFQKLDTYYGMRYNPVQEQVGNLSRAWLRRAAFHSHRQWNGRIKTASDANLHQVSQQKLRRNNGLDNISKRDD